MSLAGGGPSQAHQRLRDQLTRIRGELGRNGHAATELQVHCIAFCPCPGGAPCGRGRRHELFQPRALAAQAKTAPAEALPGLRRELDGLAAIAEPHFRYAERAIGAALDKALGGGSADRAAWPGTDLT